METADRAGRGRPLQPRPEKLWATVYEDDDEAEALWLELTDIPKERLVRRDRLDNYWHMGIPGPGGPCSEIFYDRGPQYGPEGGPTVDEDRFLEIWNLVFTEFELGAVRSKADFDIVGPLPKKNIDTGMGLERVASVLQGVDNLYEIDQVRPVLDRAAEMTGKRYGQCQPVASQSSPDDVRLRVVADHVGSCLMIIGDGVTPGNEGRGYVLRRVIRRAVRSMRLLGVDEPTLPRAAAGEPGDKMKASPTPSWRPTGRASSIAYAEEEAFRQTLRSGTQISTSRPRETKGGGRGPELAGRRVQAPRHVRLPDRPDPGDGGRGGHRRRRGRFRRLMKEQRERAKADAKAKRRPVTSTSPPTGDRRRRWGDRVHRLLRG